MDELNIDLWIKLFGTHLCIDTTVEYLEFIESHKDPEVGTTELHHVIPKSLYKGSKLVKLLLTDHYTCHMLLAKCFKSGSPERKSMSYALHMMSSGRCKTCNSEIYAYSKLLVSETTSGEHNPMYGRQWTDEQKKVVSDKQKGSLNHFYGKHHTNEAKRKLSKSKSESNQGRVWINNKTSNKFIPKDQIEYFLGNGYVLGRLSPSIETRMKMSESHKKQ